MTSIHPLRPYAWPLAFGGIALAITLMTQQQYYLDIVVLSLMWGGMAAAWNLAGGFAGQFSLGHAGFFGIGAYTTAILHVKYGISPWLGGLAGAALAGLLATALGALTFRLRGPFYTMSTIAFAELLRITAVQLRGLTGGTLGFYVPYNPSVANMIFPDRRSYALLALGLMLVIVGVATWIQQSRLGYYLVAMRENEDAARSLGVRTFRLKVFVTALSAVFMAFGGTFLAQYVLFLDPEHTFGFAVSVQVAMMAIVGGTGHPLGPVIGAAVLIPLSMFLRAQVSHVPGLDLLVYGLILIAFVLFRPEGLFVTVINQFQREPWARRSGGKQRAPSV